jgi:CubicO group peptidase (beta-lactamase class C family)
MRRLVVAWFALLAIVVAIPLQSQNGAADLRPALDSLISRLAAADSFSGAVMFVPAKGGAYERSAGLANRETTSAINMDTKIQIASTTKLFTNIAIRQLEQAGKLSLSDTVGKFLPEYHNATVRSKVTVEQLLKHRSGVGSFWNQRFLATLPDIRSVNDYIALFQDDPLLFEPGTGEAYSNGGYVILGAIIERVSGTSYHDYLREHVFGPAGMNETMPYDRRSPRSNAAIGYTFQPLAGPMTGDRRLAGPGGQRPGYAPPAGATPGASSGARLRLIGPDGKEMSQDEARAAMARRAQAGMTRQPNVSIQPGMSGPAGDHYSTVGDFVKLARAILDRTLLDSAHTTALLGTRYARGMDFRANGGGPGTNAEFSIFPSGEIMIVLSNYDPPAATTVAQFIRSRLLPAGAQN